MSREPVQTPGWSNRLLMFGITSFIIPTAIYIGILFGYKPYLQSQLDTVNDRIQRASQAISKNDQARVALFAAQLANVKNLLDNHVASSKVLAWLEKNTHTNVFYEKFSFKKDGLTIGVTAVTRSIDSFVEQAKRLEKDPDIEKVVFQSLAAAEKTGWNFLMAVTFKPKFANQAPPISPTPSSE